MKARILETGATDLMKTNVGVSDIRLVFLADAPWLCEPLAGWVFREWFRGGPVTYEHVRRTMLRRANRYQTPLSLVAMNGPTPVGTCSLITDFSRECRQAVCLVSGLYVLPKLRRKRVGSSLCLRAIDLALGLGKSGLYLYTISAERFFERNGFRTIQSSVRADGQILRWMSIE